MCAIRRTVIESKGYVMLMDVKQYTMKERRHAASVREKLEEVLCDIETSYRIGVHVFSVSDVESAILVCDDIVIHGRVFGYVMSKECELLGLFGLEVPVRYGGWEW